jgi:hypothetical protein
MKGNYTTTKVDVAERYTSIDQNYQDFHGRPKSDAYDLIDNEAGNTEENKPKFTVNDIIDPGNSYKLN